MKQPNKEDFDGLIKDMLQPGENGMQDMLDTMNDLTDITNAFDVELSDKFNNVLLAVKDLTEYVRKKYGN